MQSFNNLSIIRLASSFFFGSEPEFRPQNPSDDQWECLASALAPTVS